MRQDARQRQRRAGILALWLVGALTSICGFRLAHGEELTLDDGRRLVGALGQVDGVAETPGDPKKAPALAVDVKRIQVVDDELRRVFVPKRRIVGVRQPPEENHVKIHVPQRVAQQGLKLGSVGQSLRITPFDEFGRRIFSMKAAVASGKLDVVQGITEVTPRWTKVEGLLGAPKPIVWTMRIATSSIPRDVLSKVLRRSIKANKANDRMEIVMLYIQAERYDDARQELEEAIRDFPELERLKSEVRNLRQLNANRLLAEVELRQKSGQHRLAQAFLEKFPAEDVAGEVLIKVKSGRQEYQKVQQRLDQIRQGLPVLVDALEESPQKKEVAAAVMEILQRLSIHNYARLASYALKADAAGLRPEQRLALAVSGWVVGSDDAVDNLAVALSLVETRRLARAYLQSTRANEHAEILRLLSEQEGATPRYLTLILRHMRPPLEPTAEDLVKPGVPGFFHGAVPTVAGEADVDYFVQLPPEYDPDRRYPTLVTLHGEASTAEQQIEWWAGTLTDKGQRIGHAGRNGYIVIAPAWGAVEQHRYGASAREHAAVLNTLRDACRRFSIDTDRVLLSGHSMGGDAAWEIGASHPDLWAGVIPIVAQSSGKNAYYWENVRDLPFYFVAGEMDGTKMADNARELDRYLRYGFDCTVVEYLGRGHEHFYDEVLNLFDWANRKQRNFNPLEFKVVAGRPWDNFFWWLELSELPHNRVPPKTTATIGANKDRVNVRTAAGKVRLYLTPEMVDFQKPISIQVNGARISAPAPDIGVILEDVRTRGDRQHPFWAVVER